MADVQKYIQIVKKELAQYICIIFEKDNDKNIFEDLFETYTNVRYFNDNEKIKRKEDLRKIVLAELEKQRKNLIKKYDKIKLTNMCEAFGYIIYFDNVGSFRKIDTVMDKIVEFREQKLNKTDSKSCVKELMQAIQQYNNLKQEYLKKFESEYFKLRNKKTTNSNLIQTTLRYNIDFPKAYTLSTIEEMFNTGITKEDKLLIEYNMLNAMLLKDVIKGEFCKEYLIEFVTTILTKKSKLNRVVKVLSDDSLKERINLLIDYKEFTNENKDEIYSLMRQGYKIAVKLDNETELTDNRELSRLNVFSYILINEKAISYSKLNTIKEISKKIVKM